jgi:hypothetical protein
MYLAKVIINISILFWLLPPFRQIKGGFFLYFLILGYSDPLGFMLIRLRINPYYTHFVIAFLLVLSVMYYNKTLTLKWIVPLILFLFFFLWRGNNETLIVPIMVFHFIIFLQIVISSAKEFQIKQKISVYFPILLIYELTIILKFVALEINFNPGFYLFYMTSAFEILVCLFFIFYNLDNSPLIKLPISSKYDI